MSADWKKRPEGGGWFAIRLIRTIGRYGGRPLARACLYPITAYYLIRRAPERNASRAFLTRMLGRRVRIWDVARHIHTFASTILDRVFLLSEQMRRFDVQVEGVETVHKLIDDGRGVLLFGSHLGSFDVLRVLSRQRPDIKLRVVLDKGHSPQLTRMLDALNPDVAATVIDAGQPGPAIMLEIQQAIDECAMVALLVDRVQPGEPAQVVPFMGAPASLPTAPWLIATVLGAPVVLAFGLYRGGNRYDLVFEPFSDGIRVPRAERAAALSALIRRYATRLEHYVRQAPYNWFNFYDFWDSQDDRSDDSLIDQGRTRTDGHADARGADDADAGDGRTVHRASAARRA